MSKGRILVVEDTQNVREIIAFTLRKCGYDVVEASEGEEGARKASTEKFDLILLDAMLPNKTGFEICTDLKSNPETKHIPVIIATAITKGMGQDDAHWRQKSGADDFISKPFRAKDLVERIEKLLNKTPANKTLFSPSKIETERS